MDENGQITYHGRADDMMNAGGFRVSPLEVEAAMTTHPGITQCAVTEIEVKADTRLIMAFYTGPAPIPRGRSDGPCHGPSGALQNPAWFFPCRCPTYRGER